MRDQVRTIGVDLDGVLAQFDDGFIQKLIQASGGKDLRTADNWPPRQWHWPEAMGYTGAEIAAAWDLVTYDSLFWRTLSPYRHTPGWLETLAQRQDLNQDLRVYFVTARLGVFAKWQTERWLAKYGYPLERTTVIIAADKAAVARATGMHAYIDDRVENAVAVARACPSCTTILWDQPWNQPATYEGTLGSRVQRISDPAIALRALLGEA